MASLPENDKKLSDIFTDLWTIYTKIENTDEPIGSQKIQKEISEAVKDGELGIYMINELQLFSTNEQIEEIATNELRLMLTPALLGYLTLKTMQPDRLEIVKQAQGFYIDYLKLCRDYDMTNVDITRFRKTPVNAGGEGAQCGPSRPVTTQDTIDMGNSRQKKIERFKQQKEMENKLKELFKYVNQEHVDDEVTRDYYTTLLRKWIGMALEELEGIEAEIQLLEHRKKMIAQGTPIAQPSNKPKKAFQPFIITKNDLQKKVLGAGYPSLPSMTVEEFYDQQVKDGVFPAPGQATGAGAGSLQDRLNDPEAAAEADEEQAKEKERKVEEDDEKTLKDAREWDDWRDDHRRGWGNTSGKG